jgi:hypothetical protein
MTWQVFILVLALVLFVLAAARIQPKRVHLGWAGMACLAGYWVFFS